MFAQQGKIIYYKRYCSSQTRRSNESKPAIQVEYLFDKKRYSGKNNNSKKILKCRFIEYGLFKIQAFGTVQRQECKCAHYAERGTDTDYYHNFLIFSRCEMEQDKFYNYRCRRVDYKIQRGLLNFVRCCEYIPKRLQRKNKRKFQRCHYRYSLQ